MSIIVKKFGGTSVGNIDLIKGIAHKIASLAKAGESIVLVVSAMAKTTDELFRLAYEVSDHPSRRELDMLLTAGERISMSLLSLALHNEGLSSISFTGSQSGILTDGMHGNARILDVKAFRIRTELDKGKIVIVAGFQGVSPAKEITTLGRGGSDTSAVALASYLNADRCEIYTDVDGVYTADPRLVKTAHKLDYIDYETMLALAYSGSKVLHPRAVEFACKYNIPVEIKSSFTFDRGTLLDSRQNLIDKGFLMEERVISAIAHKDSLVRYQLKVDDALQNALTTWNNEIFKYYMQADTLELVIESRFAPEIDHLIKDRHLQLLQRLEGSAFITLVGLGINLDPSFLAEAMQICQPFDIQRISHSDKTLELMLPSTHLEGCLNALHQAFIGAAK